MAIFNSYVSLPEGKPPFLLIESLFCLVKSPSKTTMKIARWPQLIYPLCRHCPVRRSRRQDFGWRFHQWMEISSCPDWYPRIASKSPLNSNGIYIYPLPKTINLQDHHGSLSHFPSQRKPSWFGDSPAGHVWLPEDITIHTLLSYYYLINIHIIVISIKPYETTLNHGYYNALPTSYKL